MGNAVGREPKNMTTAEKVKNSYEKAAIYYHDSDCVEYIREDKFCIYDRVDGFLTLVQDSAGNLIGFKLKGFKNRFEKLKNAYELSDGHFLPLVRAIESICEDIGKEVFSDERRAEAYRAAYSLAANDNVILHNQIDQAA